MRFGLRLGFSGGGGEAPDPVTDVFEATVFEEGVFA